MLDWKKRTSIMIGDEKLKKLASSNILLIGVGGVGSSVAEMLVRAGIEKITIVDGDVIEESNINRQLLSSSNNVGKVKVVVQALRLMEINPELQIKTLNKFLKPDDIASLFEDQTFDYVVDAIDSFSTKFELMLYCHENKIPLISSMAAGGRFDLSQIKVADISKTYMCSMSRNFRKELKKHKIYKGIAVVFSSEDVCKDFVSKDGVGSIPYIPVAFGLHIASYVINKLINKNDSL